LARAAEMLPGSAWALETLLGLSPHRPLPHFRGDAFLPKATIHGPANGREVVLLADTFNIYFEPQILRATVRVLAAAGYRVHLPRPSGSTRPLCCGRTFLAAGLIHEARAEARRTLDSLRSYIAQGLPIIGVEPACLLTLRDEYAALLPGYETADLAVCAVLLEEFLAAEQKAGTLSLDVPPQPGKRVLLHGHCHQKAFGAMPAVESALRLVPELTVETVQSSCCGMAGAFGYAAETFDTSMAMGELSLLPAVRAAGSETLVVADGTSCRQQIRDGAGRDAMHVAEVLDMAIS
jgi:Fe-S oxidoreductase